MEQKEAEKKITDEIVTDFQYILIASVIIAIVYLNSAILGVILSGGLLPLGVRVSAHTISWGIVHAKKYD